MGGGSIALMLCRVIIVDSICMYVRKMVSVSCVFERRVWGRHRGFQSSNRNYVTSMGVCIYYSFI